MVATGNPSFPTAATLVSVIGNTQITAGVDDTAAQSIADLATQLSTEDGLVGPINAAVAAAAASATAAQAAAAAARPISMLTWAALAAVTGTYNGQPADSVDSGGGTHTDPLLGAGTPNIGRFVWNTAIGASMKWCYASPLVTTGLATDAETIAGSDAAKAVTSHGDKAALDARFVGASFGSFESLVPATSLAVLDTSGNLIGQVPDPAVAPLVATAVTAGSIDTLDPSAGILVLDPAGNLVAGIPTQAGVDAAVGAVSARVTVLETASGDIPNNYRASALRQARHGIVKRAFDEPAQVIHAALGDSLTQNGTRWIGPLLARIQQVKSIAWNPAVSFTPPSTLVTAGSLFGSGGGGWTGYASASGTADNGNADPAYGYSRTGTWIFTTYYTSVGPDLGALISSTPGSRVIRTTPATPALSAFRLAWQDTADGVIRYSWDAGSTWTSINTQGTVDNYHAADLTVGMPTGGGTCWIEVVSGTVKLLGDNCKSSASGYVMHKLGATGSRADQWAAAVVNPQWRAGFADLQPTTTSIMLDTNDDGINTNKLTFKAYIQTIVANVLTAVPTTDLWLIAVAQTPRVMAVPMSDYAAAMYEVALAASGANAMTFTHFQDGFGDPTNPLVYSSQGARPWYQDDNNDGLGTNDIHPYPPEGGRVMQNIMFNTLFYYP